jgi:hypothetical protein
VPGAGVFTDSPIAASYGIDRLPLKFETAWQTLRKGTVAASWMVLLAPAGMLPWTGAWPLKKKVHTRIWGIAGRKTWSIIRAACLGLALGYFEKFKFGYRVGFSLSGKEQKMVHMGSYSAVFCDAARE